MHKQIFFLLLLTATTVSHGMKRQNIIQNNNHNDNNNDALKSAVLNLLCTDLLPQFTTSIYTAHNYQPCSIKKTIRSLSDANRFFHNYFAQEKVQQELIDLYITHNNSNTRDIARDLKCRTIYTKIKRLTHIVRDKEKELNEDHLTDPWYLNITTTYHKKTSYHENYNEFQYSVPRSLLYIAIDCWQLEKAINILNHAQQLSFNYSQEQNPLWLIVSQRNLSQETNTEEYNQLLAIARLLLTKKILIDGRNNNNQDTPLMYATKCQDKELVQLLLTYNANLYLESYNEDIHEMENAFDIEPEQGWLQKIIDEVEQAKNLKAIEST
ncbi:MAG TPA: hypothetical protein VHX42_03255 [Candidatus Babeliales bacterium]|jgi:hypothetical protein|nr:hypothetical protein [Candidatus Babeliales bacterium]